MSPSLASRIMPKPDSDAAPFSIAPGIHAGLCLICAQRRKLKGARRLDTIRRESRNESVLWSLACRPDARPARRGRAPGNRGNPCGIVGPLAWPMRRGRARSGAALNP